jgi:hypothetical protein
MNQYKQIIEYVRNNIDLPGKPQPASFPAALEWIAPDRGDGGDSVETKPRVRHPGGSAELPLEERVRLRAHQLYIERGNESGSEMDDWLQAEEELSAAQEERLERD